MQDFSGKHVQGLPAELRQTVLNTLIGDILLMPPLATTLIDDDNNRQQVGSWIFSLRDGRGNGIDLLDCLPQSLEDGFLLSCVKNH